MEEDDVDYGQFPMDLLRSVVTHTTDSIVIEMIYGNHLAENEKDQFGAVIRLPLPPEKHPMLPELQLEALKIVRDVVREEIRRIESERGP
jgi:hypothetical protein